MTLQQLRLVVALDKERHFARAAVSCAISQPGLTIQLKNLEEEIGIRIFDRSRVPLEPTPHGLEIIKRAKKVLKETEDIRQYVVNLKNTLEGSFRLGIVPTLSPYLVPRMIKALQAHAPKVQLIIREDRTLNIIESLENGTLDIGLLSTPTGHAGLKEYPVFNEPFVAYLHPAHRQAASKQYEVNEKDSQQLLLLKDEFCYNSQLLRICHLKKPHALGTQVHYEVTSIETLKNLARANMGLAILPELSVQHEPGDALVKPIKGPRPVREISLVVSENFSKVLLLEKLNQIIWNNLPPHFRSSGQFKKITWNDSPYFRKALSGRAS